MPDESLDTDFLNQVTEKGAVVPSLWSLEVGNVLLIAERNKRITPDQRHKALYALKELPITVDVMTSDNAWLETMALAESYGLTLYDASYLELALRRSLPLATFDKSLKQAAKLAGVLHMPKALLRLSS
jgi:predicted nucleic acid-binding protein